MVLAGGTLTGANATLSNTAGANLTVQDGATLAMTATNASGATFALAGAMLGQLNNLGGLSLSGDLTGNLSNAASGTATVTGASSVSAQITNAGIFEVNESLSLGTFVNANTLRITNAGRLAGGALSNTAGLILSNGGIITANVTNTGTMTLSGVTTAGTNLSNEGTGVLNLSGTTTVGGNLTNGASALIAMADGVAGDRMIVRGDANLNGTIEVDVDLTGAPNGFDRIDVSGSLSGAPVIAFAPIGGDPELLPYNYDILTYGGASSLTPTTTGLPTDGAVLYQLADVGGAWRLNSGANPAIGGLASGLALTQSLIGSVVNRPSSPFVTALAVADEDPCGLGSWARATGGRAEAKGTSETSLGTFEGELSADYAGFQAGFDYACSGGVYNGWDLSFGGSIGANEGSTTQPVFQFNPNLQSVNRNAISSVNKTDFAQTYGGLYLGAARDRLFADVQVRVDKTEFELRNVVLPGGVALGVADQDYSSSGQTVSGSIGYAFPINPEQGLSLVPGLGFSFSNVKVGDLRFSNDPNDPADDGLLQIDDVKSRIGFVSLTLARSQVLPDEISAISYFGTATVYQDFASGTRSNYFTTVDANGAPVGSALSSTSSNLGAYGELSIGMNYTRLLDNGLAGAARQLDASVRLDGRFSDRLDSWGLTAQVRLQF
jgi:hypothetical protein